MDSDDEKSFTIDYKDVEKTYISSRGKGGQNVNRRSTCVVLKHIPTGIIIRSEDTRYQGKNEEIAWKRLYDKLKYLQDSHYDNELKNHRLKQIGGGERCDRKRTYRINDNVVIDYDTGKKCTWKDFSKGKIELLR